MGYLLISRNVYQECTRTSNNQASLWPNIPCQPPSLDGNTGVRTGPPARCCCLWRDTVGCWPHCTQSSQRLSCFSSPCCRERTRYRCGTDYCIANLHSAIDMLNYIVQTYEISRLWPTNAALLQYLVIFIVICNRERVRHLGNCDNSIHILLFVKDLVFLLFNLKLKLDWGMIRSSPSYGVGHRFRENVGFWIWSFRKAFNKALVIHASPLGIPRQKKCPAHFLNFFWPKIG